MEIRFYNKTKYKISWNQNQKSIFEKRNPKSMVFSKADRRFQKIQKPLWSFRIDFENDDDKNFLISKTRNTILKTTETDFISNNEIRKERFEKFKDRSENLWNPKTEIESRNPKQEIVIKIQNPFWISICLKISETKKRFSKKIQNRLIWKKKQKRFSKFRNDFENTDLQNVLKPKIDF